jgi:hypothetical protein
MKTIRKSLVILAFSLSAFAFAQDPKPTMPSGTATIYFYRLRLAYGAILKPSVFCDKKQIARMRNGRYVSVALPVGEHTITSNLPGNGAVIDFKAGETYYVRLGISPATMWKNGRGEVMEVTAGQGKFEVSQLKPAEAEDLKEVETAPTTSNQASSMH